MANSQVPDYKELKRNFLKVAPKTIKPLLEQEKKLEEARDKLLDVQQNIQKIEDGLVKAEAKMKSPRRVLKSHGAAAKQLMFQAQRSLTNFDVAGFMAAAQELHQVKTALIEAIDQANALNEGHDTIKQQRLKDIKAVKIEAK